MRIIRRMSLLGAALLLALAAPALAQQFDWQQAKGTQLRVLMNKHPWQGAIEPHLKDFEARTGIKLIAEVYPEDQFRAKVLVELTSGSSSIDVFMSMPAQEGLKYMRAGWLQPLDEMLKSPALTAPDYNWNDFLEKTREAMVIEGKLVGVPIQVENTSLMYRKDVFQKYNVKVPTTLDELEAAAKALERQGDDRRRPAGLRHRRPRQARGRDLAVRRVPARERQHLARRQPRARRSTTRTASGRSSCTAGSCACTGLRARRTTTGTRRRRSSPRARPRCTPTPIRCSRSSRTRRSRRWSARSATRYSRKGPKGQYGSTVAAWGLAMPKSGKNQKAAWLFMQWATAKDQVMAVQSEKGVLGARESVWKDPKGSAKVPADLKESLTVGSKVGTPLWNPPVVAVAECRDAIGAAIVTSIQGGDVKAAANKAAADVKRIMAETEKK